MGGFDVFGMGLLLFVRSIVVMVMAGFYGCRMGNGIDSHAFFFQYAVLGSRRHKKDYFGYRYVSK